MVSGKRKKMGFPFLFSEIYFTTCNDGFSRKFLVFFPDKKDGAFIVSFISVYHNGSIRAKN